MPPAFSLGVLGAPYPNKDGSNREFEIRLCDPGDPVSLRPEPKNRFDEHAVAVYSRNNIQMGYVESDRAPQIGVLLRAGHELRCIFQQRTSWGCIIRIGVDEDPTLPVAKEPPSLPDEWAQPQVEFEPDWLPPDE